MAWEQLSINKPHLAYLILGGFTSIFMLVSLYVKERLYIGEATVATICGLIFGPHGANLFNPLSWGNVDQITLEASRIVLVVQCFAVGVELPKAYMERHWRSVSFLLVPVMTFGWLATSLFIWWLIKPLTWLESLCCAACVTATDPVLASSVVGKGKFAKRVPKHLRDVLSAESGCNDGMAFPFIYLSIYLIHYNLNAKEVVYHWLCFTVLYECIFGAVYGFTIGYIGRHAIKWADRRGIIDRESFLVFYFVLALFCAGSGSLLGIDDLLVGFSAGVGFSNDGWFTQKTEESHVSNVIDLLLNLAYFVFLGAVIPWQQFNAPEFGITPWRLVVIALLVLFFRRIPIMLALKPLVPDIKNWREALFAGHFGPIGVGAIFAAIITRAELETNSVTPLETLPGPGSPNYVLIQVIWPITTFLVITSIIVHGSSIAVFTLGKRINTLTLTMSYTQANENGPSWMNRLPRIQSVSRNSYSRSKGDFESTDVSTEKLSEYPPGTLPPIGFPGNFLRRQKEEDNPSRVNSRASSLRPRKRKKKQKEWDGMGPGGPISQSAIMPRRESEPVSSPTETLAENRSRSSEIHDEDEAPDEIEMQEAADKGKERKRHGQDEDEPDVEAFEEGHNLVIEDEEGNVLQEFDTRDETERQKKQHVVDAEHDLQEEASGEHTKGKYHSHTKNEGEDIKQAIIDGIEHPGHPYRNLRKKIGDWGRQKTAGSPPKLEKPEHKRGPAHAYQYGNTIIVEDEDGEVVKKYDIPNAKKKESHGEHHVNAEFIRERLQRMGTWAHLNRSNTVSGDVASTSGGSIDVKKATKGAGKSAEVGEDDDRIRFTVTAGGKRMGKEEFIKQIQSLDPKARCEVIEESDVHDDLKHEAREDAKAQHHAEKYAEHSKKAGKTPRTRPPPIDHRATSYQFPTTSPESERKSAKVHDEDVDEGVDEGDSSSTERPRRQPQVRRNSNGELYLVDSNGSEIPYNHNLSSILSSYNISHPSTPAAQRRMRLSATAHSPAPAYPRDLDRFGDEEGGGSSSDTDGTADGGVLARQTSSQTSTLRRAPSNLASAETAAERRRRLAALGETEEGAVKDSDSEDDGQERRPKGKRVPVQEPQMRETERGREEPRVKWGSDVEGGDRGRRGRRVGL
ncbi:MAG: hypothetical protein MMC33_004699 [Icmadophila ericetorum]|nr:hypothetical protein [Icmadophila ericetorum]